MTQTIKIKRGPQASIPVLADGELVFSIDTQNFYVGYSSAKYPVGFWEKASGGDVHYDGLVGISNDAPGDSPAGSNDLVVGDGVGSRGLSILSSSSLDGNVWFADVTSGTGSYAGFIQYHHGTDYLRFGVNSSEAMRIDSSGNMLMAGASTLAACKVNINGNIRANNVFEIDSSSNGALTANAYYNSGWKYRENGFARQLGFSSTGILSIDRAISGTAEGTITWISNLYLDASGLVGINNSSPSVMPSGANDLVIGDGTAAKGMTIYSSTSTSGSLYFADGVTGDEKYRGYVLYNHTDDALIFGTSAAEAMRIDSSGNLGVEGRISLREMTAPTATANYGKLYVKSSTSNLYFMDDSGAEWVLSSGALWTASGSDIYFNTGLVGINNSSPSVMFSGANNLVIGDGSAAKGMTIYSSTSTSGSIYFADGVTGDERYRGYVLYNHNTDALIFGTSAVETMRIDSGGDVGIGTSTTVHRLTVADDSTDLAARFSGAFTQIGRRTVNGASYGV